MYRDAATLRTHMAIMHSEGRYDFVVTLKVSVMLFKTLAVFTFIQLIQVDL